MKTTSILGRLVFAASFCSLPLMAGAQDQNDWMNMMFTASLENDQVSTYLNTIRYTFYTKSAITRFMTEQEGQLNEHSRDVVIPLPGISIDPAYIAYGTTDYTDTIWVEDGMAEARLRNLVPQQNYIYKAETTAQQLLTQGAFNTEGHLRMLHFDSVRNVRDMGGWLTGNGCRLRYGMLYRGSELTGYHNSATPADIHALRALGIGAELDMRKASEHAEGTMRSAFGEEFPYLYLEMADGDDILGRCASEFGQAFSFVLDNFHRRRPVYLHCVYGSDRTGTFCALLELLCGVTLDNVYKDYELSSMSSYVGTRSKDIINVRILRALGFYGTGNAQQLVWDYFRDQCGVLEEDLDLMVRMLVDTGDDLPTDIPTGIGERQGEGVKVPMVFSLDGTKRNKAGRGVNIIRRPDGSIIKTVRKYE